MIFNLASSEFNESMEGRSKYVKAARPVADDEMFTLSIRHQEYLKKAIFYGLRCSAIGRFLIRRGSVSQGFTLIGCG